MPVQYSQGMIPDGHERRSPLTVWLIVAVLLLPPAYVLSSGPAAWLYAHGYITDPTFQAYLTPLRYLGRRYRSIAFAMESYMSWWVEP